jgi:hypothetical protein
LARKEIAHQWRGVNSNFSADLFISKFEFFHRQLAMENWSAGERT